VNGNVTAREWPIKDYDNDNDNAYDNADMAYD